MWTQEGAAVAAGDPSAAVPATHLSPLPLRVLVVDDEPFAATAHARYVARVDGFDVVGIVGSGREALSMVLRGNIDLVLLDLGLPDMSGLDVARVIRGRGIPTDVLAITSAREVSTVRSAADLGVVHYLLKPFAFATLAERLRGYRQFRADTAAPRELSSQHDVDLLVAGVHPAPVTVLPKGLSEDLLGRIVNTVRDQGEVSAAGVAHAVEVSRVTARRYLEHLVGSGLVRRQGRRTGPGRPVITYTWEHR
ncbi:response regulator [Austwickia sp. TVS 96-490-7B]|uniref:response regulator n=1 Tax=Austwickia sp. TVS 96-490-7B TaxID=2830843 RepID=UPI001C581E34|nr:response regulator [Austwickia sp. TVS 96-490-7B]